MEKPDKYITFGLPDIGNEEISEVIDTLKSGWISTGPKVKLFEHKFKNYIGCENAVAVNSCTAALHLSLICRGVGLLDEVIVTPLTFAATVNVIENVRAKPVFVDIEKDSYNIDPKNIQKAITKKTKAIIPVHFGGLPCDMGKINKIAKDNDLIIIEDAAHAVGAEYNSKKIGLGENTTCFSFYATKNITAAEGGMITTKDEEMAKKMRMASLHGLSDHAWQRYGEKGRKMYEVIYPGYKYNMADINASIALHQLDKIDRFNKLRKKYADLYFDLFEGFDLIELPPDKEDSKNVWHLFPILLSLEKLKISRLEFMEMLDKANIGSGIHYTAIHTQPYYAKKYGIKNLERAEYVSERTVSIPLQTSLTSEEVIYIADTVKKILKENEKRI